MLTIIKIITNFIIINNIVYDYFFVFKFLNIYILLIYTYIMPDKSKTVKGNHINKKKHDDSLTTYIISKKNGDAYAIYKKNFYKISDTEMSEKINKDVIGEYDEIISMTTQTIKEMGKDDKDKIFLEIKEMLIKRCK